MNRMERLEVQVRDLKAKLAAKESQLTQVLKRAKAAEDNAAATAKELFELRQERRRNQETIIGQGERLIELEQQAVPAPDRCPVCDWPLAADESKGCVPGNCAYRPHPDSEEGRRVAERRKQVAAAPFDGRTPPPDGERVAGRKPQGGGQ